MSSMISMWLKHDLAKAAIEIRLGERRILTTQDDGDYIESIVPSLSLIANKHACAYLAGLMFDFLVDDDPSDLSYEVNTKHGLSPDSPTLMFCFDPSLDQEKG